MSNSKQEKLTREEWKGLFKQFLEEEYPNYLGYLNKFNLLCFDPEEIISPLSICLRSIKDTLSLDKDLDIMSKKWQVQCVEASEIVNVLEFKD